MDELGSRDDVFDTKFKMLPGVYRKIRTAVQKLEGDGAASTNCNGVNGNPSHDTTRRKGATVITGSVCARCAYLVATVVTSL